MPPKPFPHCYWVVPGKLLAGEHPLLGERSSTPKKITALEEAGVGAFIDLTEPGERVRYDHLLTNATHQRFAIRDMETPAKRSQTAATLDAIDAHLANGRTVYVHCFAGIGRTGLIVGCWLARHGHMGPGALIRLQALWKDCATSTHYDSPQTAAQREYVVTWREDPTLR